MKTKVYTLCGDDRNGTWSDVFPTAKERDQAFLSLFEISEEEEALFWLGSLDHCEIVDRHKDMLDTYSWDDVELVVQPTPSDDPIDHAYLRAAQARACEGSVEVDDAAPVSQGEDAGAYVQAWIWVDDREVNTPMALIEPNGTTWFFDVFSEFRDALDGAPAGCRVEIGTLEHLKKSEGPNDAWEFLTAVNDELKLEDYPLEQLQRMRREGTAA